LAWPSHSWTLAMSASCESAFVADVARSECTHSPITSALTPVARPYFWRTLRYGARLQVFFQSACPIVFDRAEEGTV
jgi:hypothetical protein